LTLLKENYFEDGMTIVKAINKAKITLHIYFLGNLEGSLSEIKKIEIKHEKEQLEEFILPDHRDGYSFGIFFQKWKIRKT
jgi:hypothetical protein